MTVTRGREAIDLLISKLPGDASAVVDVPVDPVGGVWWVDVTLGGKTEVVGWYPERGYAMCSAPETSYGENPDVWEASPDEAAARFLGILATRPDGFGAAA